MLNVVTLIGRLVRDPETCTCDDGKIMCKFSIAVRRNEKKTNFINCIAWGKVGQEIERYYRKGDYIGVSGSINIEPYDTRHGDRAYYTSVSVDRFSFCGASYSESVRSEDPSEREESCSMFDVQYDEEELPFG